MPRRPTIRHRRPPKAGPPRKRQEAREPAVGTLPPWSAAEDESEGRSPKG